MGFFPALAVNCDDENPAIARAFARLHGTGVTLGVIVTIWLVITILVIVAILRDTGSPMHKVVGIALAIDVKRKHPSNFAMSMETNRL